MLCRILSKYTSWTIWTTNVRHHKTNNKTCCSTNIQIKNTCPTDCLMVLQFTHVHTETERTLHMHHTHAHFYIPMIMPGVLSPHFHRSPLKVTPQHHHFLLCSVLLLGALHHIANETARCYGWTCAKRSHHSSWPAVWLALVVGFTIIQCSEHQEGL